MRTIILMVTTGVLLFTSLLVAGCGSQAVASEKIGVDNVMAAASKPDSVELVYFHAKVACHCMSVVEDNIRYAVDTYFKNEVSNGKVKLTTVISDDPANAELVKRYDAMLFVLFIKETRGNNERIYPVSAIWNMTGDDNRDKLVNFIRITVTDILEGKDSKWISTD
jgi:succinylarginine dihydrolase